MASHFFESVTGYVEPKQMKGLDLNSIRAHFLKTTIEDDYWLIIGDGTERENIQTNRIDLLIK